MDGKKNTTSPIGMLTIIGLLIIVVALFWIKDTTWPTWIIVGIGLIYTAWQARSQIQTWWEKRQSKVGNRERFLLALASVMAFFLTSGTALYLWAYQCENAEDLHFNNAEYLFHSLVNSFLLFTASIDSNVTDTIKDNDLLKGLISVQAVLSFTCTVALIISLAFARLNAYLKLHRHTFINNGHNHLYIFFGMNEPSRLLAKSIREREEEKAVILFVAKNTAENQDDGGINGILSMIAHKDQMYADVDEIGARITFTDINLFDIDVEKLQDKDVLGEMNLGKISKLINRLKTDVTENAQLHVFFLSESEDENIGSVSVLAQDKTINGLEHEIIHIHCHARRNGLNRIVEDIAVKRKLDINIIDSSHLSIELLKEHLEYHPVNLVDINKDNPTTVDSTFNSLIIGFDEAGQDAMRFLYEFGAFVDSNSSPTRVTRSKFHCTAVDMKMNEKRGAFEESAPAAIMQRNSDNTPLINLIQCDCQDSSFYKDVLWPMRENLNCVIITIGNDDLGMLLAVRIFNYVRKFQKDLRHFRIFVRSYQANKESLMQKIADHYNEGYNTDCKNDDLKTEKIIIPFGQQEEVYSYGMIVDDKLIEESKVFQREYETMKEILMDEKAEFWDARRKKLTGAKAEGAPTISIDKLRSLRRKESQDIANALHAKTKMFLLKHSQGVDYDWKEFLSNYFDTDGKTPYRTGSCNSIIYPALSDRDKKSILNLARLEHLRWNASHEMLGYERADSNLHKCDERTRKHNCLIPWEELEKESLAASSGCWKADYQAYDYCVVDISILLHQGMLLEPARKGE